MTELYVPTHLPTHQVQRFLERELRGREVLSVKLRGHLLVVHHERKELTPVEQFRMLYPNLFEIWTEYGC